MENKKMLKGKGKFNIYGSKAVISIPSTVWRDSQYPFKKGEKIEVEIVGNELKIRRAEKQKAKRERKMILVIDDEKEVHELINAYLCHLNIVIYPAYSGEEGVKIYKELIDKEKQPDLVVIDLNLSGSKKIEDMVKHYSEGMDGVKTAQEILKIDSDAKIIGFTAFAHLEWGEKLRIIGVKEVLGREIGFEGFAKRVSEILA